MNVSVTTSDFEAICSELATLADQDGIDLNEIFSPELIHLATAKLKEAGAQLWRDIAAERNNGSHSYTPLVRSIGAQFDALAELLLHGFESTEQLNWYLPWLDFAGRVFEKMPIASVRGGLGASDPWLNPEFVIDVRLEIAAHRANWQAEVHRKAASLSVRKAESETASENGNAPDEARFGNAERLEAFLNRVWREQERTLARKPTKADFARVAGYADPSLVKLWQRNDAKCTHSAAANFTRILTGSSGDFVERLKRISHKP